MLFPSTTRKAPGGRTGVLAAAAALLAPALASASEADLVIPTLGAPNVILLLIGTPWPGTHDHRPLFRV